MADATLFDDTFTLTSLNNQKYDRVSRVTGTSTDSSTILSLDINHEIYPVAVGETLQVVLASTLNLDGTKEDVSKGWREKGAEENSLADMFDYVCWGKVYRFEEGEGENIGGFFGAEVRGRRSRDADAHVYVSFGGLLLYLEGPYKKLTPLRIDYVYLLIKK
ncbi:unnamed protein product, partial [Aureobasidium mustum]